VRDAVGPRAEEGGTCCFSGENSKERSVFLGLIDSKQQRSVKPKASVFTRFYIQVSFHTALFKLEKSTGYTGSFSGFAGGHSRMAGQNSVQKWFGTETSNWQYPISQSFSNENCFPSD